MTVIQLPPKPKAPAHPPAIPPTQTFQLHVELTAGDAKLVNRFLAISQITNSSHGRMTANKLAQLWFEDVAAAMRDNTTWRGGHAALTLSLHGYTW
jgi:hypothetical protein